jgi:hypothetical protein
LILNPRNTRPRVSSHHVVNHSSQPKKTIQQSSDAPVLNLPLDDCIDNTQVTNSEKREKEKKIKKKTQASDQKTNKSQEKTT